MSGGMWLHPDNDGRDGMHAAAWEYTCLVNL